MREFGDDFDEVDERTVILGADGEPVRPGGHGTGRGRRAPRSWSEPEPNATDPHYRRAENPNDGGRLGHDLPEHMPSEHTLAIDVSQSSAKWESVEWEDEHLGVQPRNRRHRFERDSSKARQRSQSSSGHTKAIDLNDDWGADD